MSKELPCEKCKYANIYNENWCECYYKGFKGCRLQMEIGCIVELEIGKKPYDEGGTE